MIGKIDVSALLQLAWVAPAASIVVALTFSLAVLGATRAADQRRAGATAAAVGYGALSVLAALAFAALVIAAVSVIVAK